MFARLKTHAESVDNDIRDLEKKLDIKTKMMFSIVNSGISESSAEFMSQLLNELEQIYKATSTLLSECKMINSNSKNQLMKYTENVQVMKEQLSRMEDYLSEFGYAKCDITREDRTSDENQHGDNDEECSYSDNDHY